MFIKKDLRKVQQILDDPEDERKEIKLFRRGPEFVNGPGHLFNPKNKASFARLEYLSLYGNSLTTVEGIGVLKDSPLKQLNLGDNLLTELPEEFRLLKQLEALWIEDNELEKFPGELLGLEHLQRLCASGNRFRYVPPEIRTLHSLRVLSLNNNAIRKLPPDLEALRELEHLDISGNDLAKLPSTLGNLPRLAILIASSNSLTTLPDELGQLKTLVRLRVNKNKLRRLPSWIQSLLTDGSLRFLNAANNKLESVPNQLHEFLPDEVKAKAEAQGTAIESFSWPHPVKINLLGNSDIRIGLAAVTPAKKARPQYGDGDGDGDGDNNQDDDDDGDGPSHKEP